MIYDLKVLRSGSTIQDWSVDAPDEQTARQLAHQQGYEVVSVRRPQRRWLVQGESARFPTLFFSIELIALLDAGLNLVEAIQALTAKAASGTDTHTRRVLETLSACLREGLPLSVALERFPADFPPIYRAVVRAAERTGDLRQALAKYVEYEEAFGKVRRKLVAALVYPAVLVCVAFLVMLFLLVYVVPRFARLYDDRRENRPFFSELLTHLGQFMAAYGQWLLVLVAVLIAAAVWAFRQEAVRAWMNQQAWRMPAVGGRMRLFQLARLYRTVGMLLRAGIPVVPALEMSEAVLSLQLRKQLARARVLIGQGQSMSLAFGGAQLGTPVSDQMMRVGERGGNMGEMLERSAGFIDDELTRWLDHATRLFEPILMAVLGVGIGFVVVIMYMPIFELAGSLK